MEEKRKQILKQNYHPQGIIILTILFCFGMYIILSSKILEVKNVNMLFDILSKYCYELCFAIYFVFLFIYILSSYILNFLVKPKKEVLYLYDNSFGSSIFINKKGKKFKVPFCDKEKGKYYYVLKTKDYIYDVLEENFENHEGWSKQIKVSYWFNFYTPMEDFEDMLLIPILYIIVIPNIMAILFASGFVKIYGLIFGIIPTYFLIYDLVYKIKQKKNVNEDNFELEKIYFIFRNSLPFLTILGILFAFGYMFTKAADTITKIAILPFFIIILFWTISEGASLFERRKLEIIFVKLAYLVFLLFWFGFLTFVTISFFKEENSLDMILFTIPFWLAGIYMFYKLIIKK